MRTLLFFFLARTSKEITLSKEIEEAKKSEKPFNFTHFVLISKLHEHARKDGESKKKKTKGSEDVLWVNLEEEQIAGVTFPAII